jgi:hypothetical protein
VPYACVLLTFVFLDPWNRLRHLLTGGTFAVVCLALPTGFRIWYFGDPLPNTHYLRMTGYPVPLRVAHGLAALAATLWRLNPLLWIVKPVSVRAGATRRASEALR